MHNTILVIVAVLFTALSAHGQFNTISSRGHYGREIKAISTQSPHIKASEPDSMMNGHQTEEIQEIEKPVIAEAITDQKRNENKSEASAAKSPAQHIKEKKTSVIDDSNLPELTIPNLLAEIKKNEIKYPKIVLAQAILETGWFKSSVCRNKHNLFGLTNPRTKTYYEFNHWTESVKAYYTKVQYRYKGGNYLLWLRDIGYAEDKGYIRAIIKVLKQL